MLTFFCVAQQRFGVCAAQAAETPNNNVNFPLILDSIVSFMVERPKKLRSKKELVNKELLIEGIELYKNEEDLVIKGIEFDRNTLIKFGVLVNAKDCLHLIEANRAEYAGTFFNVPHSPHPGRGNTRTNLVLPFTNLLIDLEAENDYSVVVTLVPRCGKVTINNVKIVSVSDW